MLYFSLAPCDHDELISSVVPLGVQITHCDHCMMNIPIGDEAMRCTSEECDWDLCSCCASYFQVVDQLESLQEQSQKKPETPARRKRNRKTIEEDAERAEKEHYYTRSEWYYYDFKFYTGGDHTIPGMHASNPNAEVPGSATEGTVPDNGSGDYAAQQKERNKQKKKSRRKGKSTKGYIHLNENNSKKLKIIFQYNRCYVCLFLTLFFICFSFLFLSLIQRGCI